MGVLTRSLRNRLAVIFGLIVLGAIGVVYFSVVPQLTDALREQKLTSLARDARAYSGSLERSIGSDVPQDVIDRLVRRAADRSGARVTWFSVQTGSQGPELSLESDSATQADPDDARFAVAEEALRTRQLATGTEPTRAGRIAEAALPFSFGAEVARVVVFSDDLGDVETNVAFIQRQLLISAAIALVVAVLAGYLVARRLAHRVRRLELAARKVAGGDFSNPLTADWDDELGRLATAFDDMQRQLAQLENARRRFIATASHELRTPIFSLGGFLELLEDEDLDEETRAQFIAQLSGQVARLRKLTTELLDLSRLESGSLQLRLEPTEVGQLVREVVAEFTPALTRHRSSVDLQCRGRLEVECDPERVAQVLRILLDNALVHTPPGTDITVSASREDGQVNLAVCDTGLGIKRQTMPHIFEPFFTSNDHAQGAGLGLAIAHELAERMDGRLHAESVPGSTRFTLELPA